MLPYLLTALFTAILSAAIAITSCKRLERRKRLLMIDQISSGLFNLSKWNSADWPQYGLCADHIREDLAKWRKAEEAGEPHAWPFLRGGDKARAQLREAFPYTPNHTA